MRANLCPVCMGKGWKEVPGNPGYTISAPCHGCEGKGWVEVHEEGTRSKRFLKMTIGLEGG